MFKSAAKSLPMASTHSFGGDWTKEKLGRLQAYIEKYVIALKNQPFELTYIDGFAGTGYSQPKARPKDSNQIECDLGIVEAQELVKGSAVIALEIQPPFHKYIFFEKKKKHIVELHLLKQRFPNLADRIFIERGDANEKIMELCNQSWRHKRAVLFLDPFGMQVEWKTLEAIARTQAIDLWLLFPAGIAVSRMLTNSGVISPGWKRRLNIFFGTTEWEKRFYKESIQADLFGSESFVWRDARIEAIKEYFVERLEEIFAGVAKNPLLLETKTGKPLYLLCFAVGNPTGKDIALRIANSILK